MFVPIRLRGGGDVFKIVPPIVSVALPLTIVVDAHAGVIAEGTVDDSKRRVAAGVGTIPDAARRRKAELPLRVLLLIVQRCAAQVASL